MPSDYGKKKASTKELRVRSSKSQKEEVYDSEEEEAGSEEESEEVYQQESGDDRSETDEPYSDGSGSEAEEIVEEAPAHHVSHVKEAPAHHVSHTKVKTVKRKAEVERVKPVHHNPPKKPKPTMGPPKNLEVKHKPATAKPPPPSEEAMDGIVTKEDKEDKEEKKASGKPAAMFSDKNVDLDLFHSSPTNVVSTKVKITPNLICTSRNIDQFEGAKANGQMYDFAALTFQRKINNGKMFEFVIPLGLAPKVVQAIQHIIQKNEKFFRPQNL